MIVLRFRKKTKLQRMTKSEREEYEKLKKIEYYVKKQNKLNAMSEDEKAEYWKAHYQRKKKRLEDQDLYNKYREYQRSYYHKNKETFKIRFEAYRERRNELQRQKRSQRKEKKNKKEDKIKPVFKEEKLKPVSQELSKEMINMVVVMEFGI